MWKEPALPWAVYILVQLHTRSWFIWVAKHIYNWLDLQIPSTSFSFVIWNEVHTNPDPELPWKYRQLLLITRNPGSRSCGSELNGCVSSWMRRHFIKESPVRCLAPYRAPLTGWILCVCLWSTSWTGSTRVTRKPDTSADPQTHCKPFTFRNCGWGSEISVSAGELVVCQVNTTSASCFSCLLRRVPCL